MEEKDDKRKREKKLGTIAYLLLFKSEQLLLEVVSEDSHSLVLSVMFHGHQRWEEEGGRRERMVRAPQKYPLKIKKIV